MKTKVTILGTESKESKKLKPIEFVKCLSMHGDIILFRPNYPPSYYEEIKVVVDPQDSGLSLFICKDHEFTHFYIGHFNDGVVE